MILTSSQRVLVDRINHKVDMLKQGLNDLVQSESPAVQEYNLDCFQKLFLTIHGDIRSLKVALDVGP
jgi:hypothetical protein